MKERLSAKKILLAFVGIFFIGVGVAFNASAHLGNDPVGIFYDGIRSILGLSETQLGTASNLVNLLLAVLLFFVGRKYLNLGTIIYILPYGMCVSAGTYLYSTIFTSDMMLVRILASVVGCVLLYLGVAIFITVDIGMDPMTGMAMVLKDWLHWDFKKGKWLFDGTLTVVGFLLGGKLGVITLVTACSAGPVIQFMAEKLKTLGCTKEQDGEVEWIEQN